ncbi:hypothetical protein ACQKJC_18855 [Priestia koreensis]
MKDLSSDEVIQHQASEVMMQAGTPFSTMLELRAGTGQIANQLAQGGLK